MTKGTLIGIGLVVVVLAGFAFALTRGAQPKTTSSTNSPAASVSATSPAAASSPTASPAASAATITYGKNGFSPATTTIKSGQTVTFINNSSEEVQIDSNPHPVHTDDTDLNVGAIAAGQSKTATLTKMGTFGFHNHLNPSDTASITIQ